MKKFYVLAAATMLAASASAAGAPQKKSANVNVPAKAQVSATMKAQRFDGVAVEANHSVAARKAARKAQPVLGEAFYKRPAGSMYGALTSAGYVLYNPYVSAKPYAPTTFVAQEADAYNWGVQLWDSQASGRTWLTDAGHQSITVEYSYETDSVPTLSNGVTEFHIGGTNADGSAGWSSMAAIADLQEWTDNETTGWVLFSPKFFGRRDGNQYSTRRFSGAADKDGGTSGLWFGHNYSGWNAMGTYVEKPENPYMLRTVQIDYSSLELVANEATIYVEVFKVASRNDEAEQYFDCKPGELIASGSYTFVKGEDPEEGVAVVPFVVEEGGLEYEITPTIDDEILIVVSGYDSDDFNNFSMAISQDEWDEGYGQHGYMMHKEGEEYTRCYGLDDFFTTSLGYVAPTVFLDVVNPFLLFNYNIEDGVRNFDKAGNCTTKFAVQGYPYDMNVISLYSYTSSEEMEFTLEDGSDLPEWLSIEAVDDVDEDGFTGEILLTVNCEANAGAPREAKVKCAIPGSYVVLSITQEGEDAPTPLKGDVNNDGVVDITDVNILLNILLDNDQAEKYEGRADVNNDGTVDISDVNELLNVMLS